MHPLAEKILNPPEKIQQLVRYLLLAILSLVFLSFLLRTPVASWYVHQRVERFNREHPATLAVGGVKIRGLASVLVTGISLRPATGDTLLKVDSAYASVGILKLLAGRIALHDVRLINTSLYLENRDSIVNYGFLLGSKKEQADSTGVAADSTSSSAGTTSSSAGYASAIDRLMGFVFDKIPLSLEIRNFNITAIAGSHRMGVHVGRMILSDHYFRTEVDVTEDTVTAKWVVAGRMDNHERMAEFRLYSADTARVRIPYIGFKWQAGVCFDTLAFSISAGDGSGELVQLRGFASVTGLQADHRKIASGPVTFDRLSVDYQLNIGPDYAEVDSATRITFNRIDFHPYILYKLRPAKQITLRVVKPQFPAQDLFSSFPEGLFTNLDGIRVKGNLSWYLDFFVDLSNPDSLRFETSLDRHQFSVQSYGNADLAKINGSFEYTAYDHDIPVRTFTVGPENPAFRPLDRISPFLQYAVLTSEDGGFFQHRGFLPDAFRESIATNIKERRFARGGSTISMQLVKNVFLSRNKTVARKLEEALIVWLIENQGLSTKERMFEAYLNLIEWGPMVYGAGEASHFYFAKEPSKLTLAEAIYLASIIPRPKWFRYSFDENGHLRESNVGFYRLVSEKMLRKGWITTADAEKLVPDVELKGPAKLLLKKTEPLPADTVED